MIELKDSKKKINCIGMLVTNLEFHRDKQYKMPIEYVVKVDIGSNFITSNNTLELAITVDVENTEKTIRASVTVLGLFNFPNGIDGIHIDEFAKVNAAMIVYPFCREAISSVSVKSGIQPILLPPFDFLGAYDQERKARQAQVRESEK